jgi:glycosyltransferase involved in cell wall biosynthesis
VKLSVVMAVRNGRPYVGEAIESVLAQSVADFEFLIVDDASTDDTPAVLADYERRDSRVRVLRNTRQEGPYPSANRALAEARGDAIARHDADDVSPPERFAIQLDALASARDVTLVTGVVEWFAEPGAPPIYVSRPPDWQPRLEWELLFTNAIGSGGQVMFPRSVRGTEVQFPAKHPFAEDYGLWCRLSRLGRVVCPRQTIYRYRRHDASITSRRTAEQMSCLSQIRYEVQSEYFQRSVSPETIAAVSRFWNYEGNMPLHSGMTTVHPNLAELRQNFLTYIGRRYGRADREALAADLDDAYRDRLGYWLSRSVRFLDRRACSDVLRTARADRALTNVCSRAFRYTSKSAITKVWPDR